MAETTNEYYANSVNVGTGLYDVTLIFSAQVPVISEPGKAPMVQATQSCIVRMSPQHAKALAALLVDNIYQYEKNFKMSLPLEDRLSVMWNEHVKGEKK